MASKFLKPARNRFVKTAMLLHQKKLIEQHYQFLRCRIEKNVLVCRGVISNPDYKNEYEVEVRCVYGFEPNTKISKPASIVPSLEIHMYSDHALCLHYPPDLKWSAWTPIYKFTIPWLVEWTVHYELYLVNGGKWEGPESPVHFTDVDRNVSDDLDF